MPTHHTARAHRPRRHLVALVLLALVAALGVAPAAGAAGPATTAPPLITVGQPVSSVTLPLSDGAPDFLVVARETFAVRVTLSRPISDTKPATLTVSATGAAFTADTVTSVVLPKGAVQATFASLKLATGANDVTLTVRATAPAKDAATVVPVTTPPFDVAKDATSVRISAAGGVTSRDGATPCQATVERPLCVDLVLPADAGNGATALFSTGLCGEGRGCPAGRDQLQVLAVFELTKANPATLIVKCDRSLCGTGAIADTVLLTSLTPHDPLQATEPCSTKGVIGADQETCVDPVQSKRDGSGDTHLYWLVPRDARMSI